MKHAIAIKTIAYPISSSDKPLPILLSTRTQLILLPSPDRNVRNQHWRPPILLIPFLFSSLLAGMQPDESSPPSSHGSNFGGGGMVQILCFASILSGFFGRGRNMESSMTLSLRARTTFVATRRKMKIQVWPNVFFVGM